MSISIQAGCEVSRRAGSGLEVIRLFGVPQNRLGVVFIPMFACWFLCQVAISRAGSITIHFDGEVIGAVATTEKEPKSRLVGLVQDHTATFTDPVIASNYEAQLTLKDGTVLQGVDMGWYSRVQEKKDAEALSEDDFAQMKATFTAGSQFFNVQEATLIQGTHNRAVMLTRQERTNAFHSDTGDQIIWRPELWYFENHHGGWEKVLQTDRVLRRERFETHQAYHAVVDHLRWVPGLGGLKVTPKNPDVTVTLPANVGIATTTPSTQPSVGAGEAKP